MFSYFLTVGGQIFMMFLMALMGYIMFKTGLLTANGIKEMSVLLLKIVTPIILAVQFQMEFSGELMSEWLKMFLTSAVTYAIAIGLSILFFRKGKAEERLSIFLPNNGFLGFPLMQALAGEFGIFLGSTSVIIMSILQWTYGIKLLCSKERVNIKKILINPGTIGVVLGMLLFISPVKLPAPIYNAAESVSSLNTPLAMICLGGMLAQTDLKQGFKNKCIYKISLVNLVIMPLIMIAVLKFLPVSSNIASVAFICSVTPVATSVSMMSQMYDGDYTYAANLVAINTAISAIIMPLMLTLGKFVLGY